MKNSMNSTSSFLEFRSLLVGVGIATVVLLIVYLVIPVQEETSPSVSPPSEVTESTELVDLDDSTLDEENEDNGIPETSTSVSSIDMSNVSKFEDVLTNFSSSFERFSALYQLVGQSTENQLVSLLNEVNDFPFDITNEYWKSDTLNILLRRLVAVNPVTATSQLEELRGDEQWSIVYWVFYDWAIIDLDSAIAFVDGTDDYIIEWAAVDGIMAANSSLPMEELINLTKRLGDMGENYLQEHFAEEFYAEELTDPEAAWFELTDDPSLFDYDNISRIRTIVEAWIERDGIAVLDTILETIPDEDMKSPVFYYALRTAASMDPVETLDYALALDAGERYSSYATTVIETWARSEPSAALDQIISLDADIDKSTMVYSVFNIWALSDSKTMLNAIGRIPEELQDNARVAAVQSLAYRTDEESESRFEVVLSLFAEIRNDTSKLQAARGIALAMARDDLDAALNWVNTDPSIDEFREQLVVQMLTHIVYSDPDKAFEHALAQPLVGEGDDAVGMEAQVLMMMGYSNIEKAVELLPKVREGKTKVQAINGLGSALAMNGRVAEAVELGNDLPENEQDTYFTTVGTSSLTMSLVGGASDSSVFDTLELIPSDDAKSKIAVSAVMMNSFNATLSEDEIEELKEYITEEDLKEMEEGMDQMENFNIPFLGL